MSDCIEWTGFKDRDVLVAVYPVTRGALNRLLAGVSWKDIR